jgi:hypothetical protein
MFPDFNASWLPTVNLTFAIFAALLCDLCGYDLLPFNLRPSA